MELLGLTLVLVVGLSALGVIDVSESGKTAAISTSGAVAEDEEEGEGKGLGDGGARRLVPRPARGRAREDARPERFRPGGATGASPTGRGRRGGLGVGRPRQLRGQWTLAGPTNVGGRIVDLVVDPVHQGTILSLED